MGTAVAGAGQEAVKAAASGDGMSLRIEAAAGSRLSEHFQEILDKVVALAREGEPPAVRLLMEYANQVEAGREAKAEEIESLAERLGREIRELENPTAE
jgi:N-acetylglucosamine kinase-like BadF-type ATPase